MFENCFSLTYLFFYRHTNIIVDFKRATRRLATRTDKYLRTSPCRSNDSQSGSNEPRKRYSLNLVVFIGLRRINSSVRWRRWHGEAIRFSWCTYYSILKLSNIGIRRRRRGGRRRGTCVLANPLCHRIAGWLRPGSN